MTEQTDAAEVEALLPWLGDLVTFAVGAYAETMIGAREAGDPSDWAESIAREFCDARRPIELAAREAAAEACGAERALREAAEAVERAEGPTCSQSETCHAADATLLRLRARAAAAGGAR